MSVFKVIWQFKSNVQSLSCFWLVVTPMVSSTPGFLVLHCLLEFAQIHVHWVMDATPFSSCPQSFPTSGSFPVSWLFTSGDQSIGASASVLPVNIQGWFFFFRIDWFDFRAVQGTLKSLLQHHGSKTSVLWCSAFFMVHLKMAIHPVLLPWKYHGQRSLVGYSPCGHKELDTTERPHFFISHIHTWLLEKPYTWLNGPLLEKWCLWF